MDARIQECLKGFVDMHMHAWPDMSRAQVRKTTNKDAFEKCREAGMGGVVLKTNGWPIPSQAHEYNDMYDDFTVFASVSLNQTAGGAHPWVAEHAHEMGAKMLWLPTWSSECDINADFSFAKVLAGDNVHMLDETCKVVDENGKLLDDIKGIVDICNKYDMVLGTGHISAEECIEVSKYCKEVGYKKLIVTHIWAGIGPIDDKQVKECVDNGAYIEFCTLDTFPDYYYPIPIKDIARIVDLIGGDRVVISTDFFWDWVPPIPEQIGTLWQQLLDEGVAFEQIEAMSKVPATLLDM